jgi:hypothetical protein
MWSRILTRMLVNYRKVDMKFSSSWNSALVFLTIRWELTIGGGLIDFMNTRLQDRLTESEILKIFGDVAQGVACMHYLQPPLLHRDIKVPLPQPTFSIPSLTFRLKTYSSPRHAAISSVISDPLLLLAYQALRAQNVEPSKKIFKNIRHYNTDLLKWWMYTVVYPSMRRATFGHWECFCINCVIILPRLRIRGLWRS